jgi:hypothetical protein
MRLMKNSTSPRDSIVRLAVALASAALLTVAVASPAGAAQSDVTHKTITKTETIPFKTVLTKTASLNKGVHKTSIKGVAGVRTKIIKLSLRDGSVVAKKVLKSTVTKKPVSKVVLVGTKVATSAKCDPNYSGECVPIASDVDCAGGSGNGPGYVYGPVEVIGSDIYDLDRDGDGVGCD